MKITVDNYYQDTTHMSVSRWKQFQKCELNGAINAPFSSTAMMVGSYVDAYVEGTLDAFIEQHPYIPPSKSPQGYINMFNAKGELASDFKKAEEVCRYIDENETIQRYLDGDKQKIVTGKIADVPFKGKLDIYHKDKCIVDLKVMRSVTDYNGNPSDFIGQYRYDVQMACYQELVRQECGKQLPCYIMAITKETPINSLIINIPQNYLDKALYDVQNSVGRYYDIMVEKEQPQQCGKCDSCRTANKHKTEIISYADIVGF